MWRRHDDRFHRRYAGGTGKLNAGGGNVNGITQWAAGVCCTAVACTLLELLFPDHAMKKTARYVISLFFLAAVVTTVTEFSGTMSNFPENTGSELIGSNEKMEQLLEKQTLSVAQESIRALAEKTMTQIGVQPQKIEPVILRNESGAYELERIIVYISGRDVIYEETLHLRLLHQLGIEPEFVYMEEG